MEEYRITIQVKKRAIHDDTKFWGKSDPTFGGNPPAIPIRIWGDNRITDLRGTRPRCAVRQGVDTHFARRIDYTQHMCKGDDDSPPEYLPAHIPTDKNTVDFFGKLVNAAKYRMSVYYNMGTAMEVPPMEANKIRAIAVYQAANAVKV